MSEIEYNKTSPIGVFDSGIGGVTILYEIAKLMPNENIIYFADDKNCPYGTKSTQQIISLVKSNVEYLISRGVKLIVVACNTATLASVKILREEYKIKFVAIEPAIKPASNATETGVVGVLATKSSIESSQLKNLCDKFAHDKMVVTQAGVGLVDLVERDLQDSEESYELLNSYISPMIQHGIDHLVLGCTHYPFLIKNISKIIVDNNIKIVNPAPSIALQVERTLSNENLLNDSEHLGNIEFISSKNTLEFNQRIKARYEQYKTIVSK